MWKVGSPDGRDPAVTTSGGGWVSLVSLCYPACCRSRRPLRCAHPSPFAIGMSRSGVLRLFVSLRSGLGPFPGDRADRWHERQARRCRRDEDTSLPRADRNRIVGECEPPERIHPPELPPACEPEPVVSLRTAGHPHSRLPAHSDDVYPYRARARERMYRGRQVPRRTKEDPPTTSILRGGCSQALGTTRWA